MAENIAVLLLRVLLLWGGWQTRGSLDTNLGVTLKSFVRGPFGRQDTGVAEPMVGGHADFLFHFYVETVNCLYTNVSKGVVKRLQ